MKLFRQLSTPRLVALFVALFAVGAALGVGAVAALGSSAESPPAKPLDQALLGALHEQKPLLVEVVPEACDLRCRPR